jgi:hypothetical protein
MTTLEERYDLIKLKYLSTFEYDAFKNIGKSDYKNEAERKKHYGMFKSFVMMAIKNGGVIKHDYHFSKDTIESHDGRLYSGNSVQRRFVDS